MSHFSDGYIFQHSIYEVVSFRTQNKVLSGCDWKEDWGGWMNLSRITTSCTKEWKIYQPLFIFTAYPTPRGGRKKLSLSDTCFFKSIIFWIAMFNGNWEWDVWMYSDGLAWAGCQTLTQLCSPSPPKNTGEKGGWKSSWVEIKTGTFSANCHHGQNRLDLKNEFNFLLRCS